MESLAAFCGRTGRTELLLQWDAGKNLPLTPEAVSSGSGRKVWWRCGRGHDWQAAVFARRAGGGCPVCAGKVIVPGENDLKRLFPAVAAQWHPTKNGTAGPETVSPGSNRKVWWLCPLGHAYQAAVAARTARGSGCPYCAGRKVLPGFNDLSAAAPLVAAQWHPTLNGELTPEMVTAGSRRKVWWQCPQGHVWKAAVCARAGGRKTGCPVCAGGAKRRAGSRAGAENMPGPGKISS